MKRETITISVSPDMKNYIQRRAAADFESVSQYIRKLVLSDNYRQRELSKDQNRSADRAPAPWSNAFARRP